MNDSNKLSDIIRTALQEINSMVDSNTVIGNPITTANGTVVIPVSKVSVGFASGGIDYKGKADKENAKPSDNNFGGGGGTGLTMSPVGFLVVKADGSVELLNINEPIMQSDPVSQIVGLIEKSPDLIERIKAVIPKKDKEKSE